MADSRDYPVDFVPGLSSHDDLNKLPRGNVFYKDRSSNESNIDGIADVITGTLVVPEDGRRQRLSASVMVRSETFGGVQARLVLNGVQRQRRNNSSLGGGADVTFDFSVDVEMDAGSYPFVLAVGRSGDGDNLVSAVADGTDGSFGVSLLAADDVGPAYADI